MLKDAMLKPMPDQSLNQHISCIRTMIAKVGGDKINIETIPKRGYILTVNRDTASEKSNMEKAVEIIAYGVAIEDTPEDIAKALDEAMLIR
jgi:DNA-binding winged helix-turn-helix (wHTH) protein